MDDIITLFLGIILMFLVAILFTTFFIYYLWPVAIPAVFPGLVASGTLAKSLTFGQAFALSWLTGALFGKVKYEKK